MPDFVHPPAIFLKLDIENSGEPIFDNTLADSINSRVVKAWWVHKMPASFSFTIMGNSIETTGQYLLNRYQGASWTGRLLLASTH
jgi:hypothetical protein